MTPAEVSWAWPRALLLTFALWFVALGIAPYDRGAWMLENVLVVIALAIFVATRQRLRFSNLSYTLLFAFFVAHEIGAHFTYARVPWQQWVGQVGGEGVVVRALARNDYDRVVHFAYGLLMLRPAVELLRHAAPPTGVWRWLLPPLFILSHAALYEQLEWAATALFSNELGSTYLGSQGDPWDSEWDVLMAVAGALVALAILAGTEAWGRRRRHAAR